MYGLWLFKEIQTEYGHCKVEIYRKGYSGSQIEITALAANSLTISLENLSSITDPIGKSVCSFSIIDTEQISYDDFFTPDATAYKVVVSTRIGSGAYTTRWSGYVTPDFFAENLSYRTPISISARDNIGYLNDVDFDMEDSTTTICNLITSAFARIAEDYPMNVVFATQKQSGGLLAIDATISTLLFREGSWYEAIEAVLHDLGLQMRWVDNNTIAVLDLSQIPEFYSLQSFNFIGGSGYREILPAWRQLSQSQDYGLRENFFEGWMRSDNLTFVKSATYTIPDLGFTQDVRYYTPNNWGVARNIYTTNPAFYSSTFGTRLFFSAVPENNPDTTYLSWTTNILTSNVPLIIKFKAFNSVIYPFGGYKPYPLQLRAYDPFLAFGSAKGDWLQIGLKMNLFLHTRDNKTYVMQKEWVEDNGTGSGQFINFTLDKVSLDDYNVVEGKGAFPIGAQPKESELTISALSIPYDGELELRIYGYYVAGYKYGGESVHKPNFDKFFTYIDDLTFTFDSGDIVSGQDANVEINSTHNIKTNEDYKFGQVPLDCGGINAYAGGLFQADGSELVGFQRNEDGASYNLLELVGREIIHFNRKPYNKLSGTIKNLAKEPLMFNRLFVREGKTYAPFSYSLDVIANEMSITSMQEVEPYQTEDFTRITAEPTEGGATVSGGPHDLLEYGETGGGSGVSGDYLPLTGGELSGPLSVNGSIKSIGGSNGSAIGLLSSGHVRVYAKTSGDTAGGVKFYTNDGSALLGTPAGVFGNNGGVKRYYYGGDYNTAPMYIFEETGNAAIGGGTTDEGVRLNVVSDSFNVAQVKRSREGNYGAVIKFALANSTLGQIGWTKPDDFTVRDGNGNKLIEGGVSGININADIVTGEVTSGSDIRYKNILSKARIDIEDIANAPTFNYKWKDNEDARIYLGSSAQYWYNTAFGNGVKATNDESKWTMAYGPIALASAVELAKEVLNQREQINVLVKEIKDLKERLEKNGL